MTKLRVLVLSFPDFTDISIASVFLTSVSLVWSSEPVFIPNNITGL
jgi:hypothetical protein